MTINHPVFNMIQYFLIWVISQNAGDELDTKKQ